MQTKYKNETSGRSMVEIIGALAVMSLISAAAVVLVRMGSESQKRSRIFDDVMTIAENVRGMYPDDFGLLDTNADKNQELVTALGFTTTPFGAGTKYSIARPTKGTDKFYVMISGLSEDDCMILSKQTWPGGDGACDEDSVVLTVTFGK